MAFTALSIMTHGWHHPGSVAVTTSEAPTITSVVEVRPTIRATVPPPTVGPAGAPSITAARSVTPRITRTTGPQQQVDGEKPNITSADNVVPRITKVEEE